MWLPISIQPVRGRDMNKMEKRDLSLSIVLATSSVGRAANLDRRGRNSRSGEQIELPLMSEREKCDVKERHTDCADSESLNYSSIRQRSDAKRMANTYGRLESVLESLRVALSDKFPQYRFDVPEQTNFYSDGNIDVSDLSIFITAHGGDNVPLSSSEMIKVKAYALSLLREAKRLINAINCAILDSDVKGVILCKEDRGYSHPIFFKNYYVAKFVCALFASNEKTANQLLTFKIGRSIWSLPELGIVRNNVDDTTFRKIKGKVRLESNTKQSFFLSGVFRSTQGGHDENFNGVVSCVNGYPTADSNWYSILLKYAMNEQAIIVTVDSVKSFVSLQGINTRKYIVVNVEKEVEC